MPSVRVAGDGRHALDGSRTFFLDAARFTYDWTEKNTKVDFVYIDHGAESDRWLEPSATRTGPCRRRTSEGLFSI